MPGSGNRPRASGASPMMNGSNFHILEGHSVVTEEGGAPVHLRAGDSFIMRPGFKGTWEVIETTRKDYVIKV